MSVLYKSENWGLVNRLANFTGVFNTVAIVEGFCINEKVGKHGVRPQCVRCTGTPAFWMWVALVMALALVTVAQPEQLWNVMRSRDGLFFP